MIYTIGHTNNYRKVFNEHGGMYKEKGGYAFGTPEEAQREIERVGKQAEWSIWCMEGDMQNTTVHQSEHFFVLLEDRFIVGEYQAIA